MNLRRRNSMDPDETPLSNPQGKRYRHESGNHGERIARLESDVFNITELISGDIHERLQELQAGMDTVKDTLGTGHVMFQELKDAHQANMLEISKIQEARRAEADREEARRTGRIWYFAYPAAAAALVVWLERLFCGGGGK
jgi:hypothetical protein